MFHMPALASDRIRELLATASELRDERTTGGRADWFLRLRKRSGTWMASIGPAHLGTPRPAPIRSAR